jgi:hypothetical protein
VNEPADSVTRDLVEWSREQLGSAVDSLMREDIFNSDLLEVRPAWAFPNEFVIGRVREQGERSSFIWVICGSTPVDFLSSAVASTPREAARHFTMKWQLEAERHRDPAVQKHVDPGAQKNWKELCDALEARASALSTLVETDGLWAHAPLQ